MKDTPHARLTPRRQQQVCLSHGVSDHFDSLQKTSRRYQVVSPTPCDKDPNTHVVSRSSIEFNKPRSTSQSIDDGVDQITDVQMHVFHCRPPTAHVVRDYLASPSTTAALPRQNNGRHQRYDCETIRIPSLMSRTTIRIQREAGWGHRRSVDRRLIGRD